MYEKRGLMFGSQTPAQQALRHTQAQQNLQNEMLKGGAPATVPEFKPSGPQLLAPGQGINASIQRMASAQAQAEVNNQSAHKINTRVTTGGNTLRKRRRRRRKTLKRKRSRFIKN